ncbi:MAG: hypothetical protein DRR19_22595 [Candidatus Parabeggiatoa sp. nov. 1]|nr:MAG: hypothetical protein DRR19_22595 [Gammaproteobacteria bacterium]
MNIAWVWVPLISIGPFCFGETIFQYKDLYQLKLVSRGSECVTGWDTYEVTGYEHAKIYCENNKIVFVTCHQDFYYQGVNFIGKTLKEVCDLLELSPDKYGDIIYINESPQVPVEFDSVDLLVWCEDEIVVSVSCYNDDE